MSRPLPLFCLILASCSALAQSPSAAAPAKPAGLHCSLHVTPHTEADKALAAGTPARAQELFTSQLAAQSSVANYTGLVDAQLAQDNFTAALETAQRAAAAFPTSADALALTGDALVRAGQVPEAFAAYTRALAVDQCSYRAHLGLGLLDQLGARHASAIHELGMAHKLAPSDPVVSAAYLQAIPPAERGPALRAFLAENPALPKDQLDALAVDSALLNDHKLCQSETPVTNASFELLPVLFTGRITRSWGIKISIDGHDLPLTELDSSAGGIVLNPSDAARANVHPVIAATPGAPYAAVADRIRIGSVEYRGCPVTVVPASYLAGANSLIGTSFFRNNLIRIDYPAHTLTLTPLPAAAAVGQFGLTDPPPASSAPDHWTPVYVSGDQLLLPTLINKKGPFLFAIDTGVNSSVYSPAVTRSQLDQTRDATINLHGTSASVVKVIPRDGGVTDIPDVRGADGSLLHVNRPVKFPTLRYANSEIPDPTVVSFDLTPFSHQAHTEVSALLGFNLLSYFYIEMNYRDGLVRLVFDQNRRYHVMQSDLQLF